MAFSLDPYDWLGPEDVYMDDEERAEQSMHEEQDRLYERGAYGVGTAEVHPVRPSSDLPLHDDGQ